MIYVNIVRPKTRISGAKSESGRAYDRTHTLIKIRVPTPSLVRRRPIEIPVYPGILSLNASDPRTYVERTSSGAGTESMPTIEIGHVTLSNTHMALTIDDQPVLESLYDQFRCLASVEFKDDPMGLGAAIDRTAYSECL